MVYLEYTNATIMFGWVLSGLTNVQLRCGDARGLECVFTDVNARMSSAPARTTTKATVVFFVVKYTSI